MPNQTITLYLAGWQKRMVKDYMSAAPYKATALARVTKVQISVIDKRQWVMYRQPYDVIKQGQWNLYLTDEQISVVAEKTGIAKIAALNVSPEMVKSGAIAFK